MIDADSISDLDAFFFNVKEGVDDMIRFTANETSVGLFYVQQHAHASMPYLLNLKEKVGRKIDEVTLHTDDIEDSISAVRSMVEYGNPIADDMIKDISRSLNIISGSHPKRGLIRNSSWGLHVGGDTSNLPNTYNFRTADSPKNRGVSQSYLSTVLNSAKQKVSVISWPQLDAAPKNSETAHHFVAPTSSVIPTDRKLPTPNTEGDELPVSSPVLGDRFIERDARTGSGHEMSVFEDYNRFRSEREAELKAWLEEPDNVTSPTESSH